MKNKIVIVPQMKSIIKTAPGFNKKELANYKLDISALCGYGCLYCSSNMGNYQRINQKKFNRCTKEQTGKSILPKDDPSLMMIWPTVVDQLENELATKAKEYGKDKVIVFSMLTDGFSPYLVDKGITRNVLEMLIEKTSFRIRVLTKNAIVGSRGWIDFFVKHKDRFVVGLSTGSLDNSWSKKVELGTSSPGDRFEALANLQAVGIPTFGMLCPVFPSMLIDDSLEKMLDLVNPEEVEHVWIEPYNDRINWKIVQSSFPPNSAEYNWFKEVYQFRQTEKWSSYATELYIRTYQKAAREGWLPKLRYLLYEGEITEEDSGRYVGLESVLLQGKPDENGMSKNQWIASL